jgi:hypothetical protein
VSVDQDRLGAALAASTSDESTRRSAAEQQV